MNEHKVKALTIRLLLAIADEVFEGQPSADAHKIMIHLEEYARECEFTADPK